MNIYTVETATGATLADAYALHPDREEAARLLAGLRERVAAGHATPEQVLILRSDEGVRGVVVIPPNPHVPLFPRLRRDTPAEQMTAFLRVLREQVSGTPQRQLLLDDRLAPLEPMPAEAAGWVSDAPAHVMYQTDLRARPYPVAPETVEGGDELRQRPEIAALLDILGQSDWEGGEDWTLVAVPDPDGRPIALGAFGPSGRPGWVNLNMIGVHPEARGQGHGTRLHAHLLSRAAERFTTHGGGTEAGNHAMRRIYQKNGSRHVATQLYFRPG